MSSAIIYTARGATSYNRLKAEGSTDGNAVVWTQVVKQVAEENIGHIIDRAPLLRTIVSVARAPAVRVFNMDLSSDVAVPQSTSRQDRDRIRIVVNAFEVSVDLGVEPIGPGRVPDPRRSIGDAVDGD